MKAGDTGGRTSSPETWLSTPLSDPNAALWASISPPANTDIPTLIRRRAAAFSLDLLAHRLHLRFPAHFSSRSSARTGILGAAVAFGASVGVIGFLAFGAWQGEASEPSEAREASRIETLQPAMMRAPAPAAQPGAASSELTRQGQTVYDATTAPSTTGPFTTATTTATATMPPTFAATALPVAAERAVVTPAQRRASLTERRAAARAKAKAKRTATAKNKARRAQKTRRAMVDR